MELFWLEHKKLWRKKIVKICVVVFCLLCNFWKHTFVSMVRFWQFR